MNSFKRKIEYVLKHNIFIQKIYVIVLSNILKFFGLFVKTQENLILINSFGGRRYNDSPKVITEYLLSESGYENYQIVWAFDDPSKFNIPCKKIKIDTLRYFITALKAKYWITSVNIERGLHFKNKSTKYLNTWHGTPLKFIGNAVSGRKDFNCSNVDIFCYAGGYEKDIYIKNFGVKEEALLLSGLPRNDELYHLTPKNIIQIKGKLGIPNGKKVILYAPTWRDSTDNGKTYTLTPPLSIDKWQKELGNEYIILFRMHAFTTKIMKLSFNEFVWDMSLYPDINELMMVSDILISDYSATIFDYSILERPIISFAYDYDTYAKERGLYIDLRKELPSGISITEDEVLNKIKSMDYKEESNKTKAFKLKYLEVGGMATRLCVEQLFKQDNG